MICKPGLCIKCGEVIALNGAITPRFNEISCEMDDGQIMNLAICTDCQLEESEFEEAMGAVNDYYGDDCHITAKIKRVTDRRKTVELLLSMQGNRCLGCHKKIDRNEDRFICTNGNILHEGCNMPRPKHDYDDPRAMGNVSMQEVQDIRKSGGVTKRARQTA